MPEKLRQFLKSLTPIEAKEIHDWLDETPNFEDAIIRYLANRIETNPELWNETFGNSIHDNRDATSIHQ